MTPEIWYYATHKFTPQTRDDWDDYIQWSGLSQLERVLSLDILLCPTAVDEWVDEDWDHFVEEDFRIGYFRDLGYLLRRFEGELGDINMLALLLEPPADARTALEHPHFEFRGYDLVEKETGISAITNCGGFDLAFSPSDLSEVGLIEEYEYARRVQRLLREHYPSEHHANCELWAIWEMRREGGAH